MTRLRDTIDRTPEYVNFIKELKQFHLEKGTTLQAEPVLGGRRLDLYKIFQVVASSGGFEEVTKNRGWKQVGDIFQFPSTCTNSAYILKGVYIRNLLGWEEEKLWKKNWKPPKELLGPNAHKSSTLAGKAYKSVIKKTSPTVKSATKTTKAKSKVNPPPSTPPTSLVDPLTVLQQLSNPLLYDFSNLNVDTTVYSPTTSNTPPPTIEDQSVFTEKDRILFALQFGKGKDVEWALDEIVTISFECPEKLDLNSSPFLLQLLVSLAQPCLTTHVADNALPTSATDTLNSMLNNTTPIEKSTLLPITITHATDSKAFGHLDISLKVLHILRNFSFLTSYVPMLAKNTMVKELLVQGLQASMSTGHVELGRHSIDVLENMAAHMELDSIQDPCLQCVQTLVAAHDRYLVIGSIRTLTWLTMNQVNHAYLETSPVMTRIAQMLLSNDEELVGTSLEYIYQYTRISAQARSRFLLSPPSNAYVGLLISLLMTKSKYFCTRFIQEDTALTTPNPTVPTPVEPMVPRVPNLTEYQKLDEPFRCLGWLKDKFEVADRSSVLSLDDMYLLYEARFGLEKALKMRDFYTVMKIAFPKVSTTETKSLLGSPGQSAPVVEGLNIIGIQIKMSILQDRPQVPCKWAQCSLLFDDTFTLQRHILHDHMPSTMDSEHYVCRWSHCKNEQNLFSTKDSWISHLRTHFYNQVGESCCNSPVQSPEPSLSPSPSTPASQISLTSTTSPRVKPVDMSDIQGIALVASHLLNWLSKDPQSAPYFIPYEKELTSIAEQRPKLATFVWSICSNFKSSKPSQPIVSINTTPV